MYLLEFVGEDDRLSAWEATAAAQSVDRVAPGLARTPTIDVDRARWLARTRAISSYCGSVEGSIEALVDYVATRCPRRPGPIAVRARTLRGAHRIDTQAVESRVGDVFAEAGIEIDLERPAHEFRVLIPPQSGPPRFYLGWLACRPIRGFATRQPTARPFEQPGTMDPQLARTVVNLSGVDPGGTLLDPMCGPGAIPLEAATMGVNAIAMDVQRRMAVGARTNLAALVDDSGRWNVLVGSADALPVREADVVVFDAPYGRQSPIVHESAEGLVRSTLTAATGVVDRCVAVYDRPIEGLIEGTDWHLVTSFERRVHRSLTRHIAILA